MFEDSANELEEIDDDEDEGLSDPIATSSEGGSNDSLDQLDRLAVAFGSGVRLAEDTFNHDKLVSSPHDLNAKAAKKDKSYDDVISICREPMRDEIEPVRRVDDSKQQPVEAIHDEKRQNIGVCQEASLVLNDEVGQTTDLSGGYQKDPLDSRSVPDEKEPSAFNVNVNVNTPPLDLNDDNNSVLLLSTDDRKNLISESPNEELLVRKPESLSQQLEMQSQQRDAVAEGVVMPLEGVIRERARAESNESLDSGNDSGAGGVTVSIVTASDRLSPIHHRQTTKKSVAAAATKLKVVNEPSRASINSQEEEGERNIELSDLQNALHLVRHQTSTTSSNSSSGSPMEIRSTKVQHHQPEQQQQPLSATETMARIKSNKKERKQKNKKEKSKNKKKSKSKVKVGGRLFLNQAAVRKY